MVAESWINPTDWYKTNILGQVNLINKILNLKIKINKFIQFSTPEVYGSTRKSIDETYNFNPSTPYAISRACFDNHLSALHQNFNFPVIFTRTANVYGSFQDLYRIVPKTFMTILNKDKLKLHGGGRSIRSFIHINDVSTAIDSIIKRGRIGETYHISTEEFVSIKQLVLKISKLMNYDYKKLVNVVEERKGKDEKYILLIKKIKKHCNWKPKIKLNEGLNETKLWIENNFDKLQKEKLEYVHKK